MQNINNEIIETARTMIGTRYKHQGRIPKSAIDAGGLDCLGLLIVISSKLNLKTQDGELLEKFDQVNYRLRPDGNELVRVFDEFFKPKEYLEIGDLVIFDFDNNPQHLAIISETQPHIKIIHSYLTAKKVVEHRICSDWIEKIIRIYKVGN